MGYETELIAKIEAEMAAGRYDVHYLNDLALRRAATKGHTKVVRFLLEHGANVHARDDQALHSAAIRKNHAMVCELLAHGASLDTISDEVLGWLNLTADEYRAVSLRLLEKQFM